jgi:hypothetical protein
MSKSISDRLQAVKKWRREQEDALFYIDHNGRKSRLHGDGLHREKKQAIDKEYQQRLDNLMAELLERLDATESAAAAANPYAALDNDLLQRAALLRPFIESDVAALDADGMVALAQSASAWADPALAWVLTRTVKARFPEDASFVLQHDARAALDGLARLADPAAHDRRQSVARNIFTLRADLELVAQHTQAWKDATADALGVNVEHIGDPEGF